MNMWSWLKTIFGSADPDSGSRCIIRMTDAEISCIRPNGAAETVAWDDLRAVIIETTDEGPFVTDLFWILVGTDSGCMIPQDAVGNEEMLERLQLLPGFDNDAVIRAMGSAENERFLIWQSDASKD